MGGETGQADQASTGTIVISNYKNKLKLIIES